MKTQDIFYNLEKLIFFGLIAIAVLIIGAYQAGLFLQGIDIEEEISSVDFIQPPGKVMGLRPYEAVIETVNQDTDFGEYAQYFKRNSFKEFVIPPPPLPMFEIRSVKQLYVNAVYKGFIESVAGIVGQIQIGERTHFVREGDEIKGYRIDRLRRSYAMIRDIRDDKDIRLPIRERVLSDEFEAVLYLPRDKKVVKTKIGDKIENFRVLDISTDYVVLLNQSTNEKITVRK